MVDSLDPRRISRILARSLGAFGLIATAVAPASLFAAEDDACPVVPLTNRRLESCTDESSPASASRPGSNSALRDVCPPGAVRDNGCSGLFAIPAGSGGARVVSFVSRSGRYTNDVRVEWTCPDERQDVRVVLSLGGYLFVRAVQCKDGGVGLSREEFRNWRNKRVEPFVTVLLNPSGRKCVMPVYLLAVLSAPHDLLNSEDELFRNARGGRALLAVESNFAGKEWEIRAGDRGREGSGTMGVKKLVLERPADCRPITVDVDFDRGPSKKPTSVAEVRF